MIWRWERAWRYELPHHGQPLEEDVWNVEDGQEPLPSVSATKSTRHVRRQYSHHIAPRQTPGPRPCQLFVHCRCCSCLRRRRDLGTYVIQPCCGSLPERAQTHTAQEGKQHKPSIQLPNEALLDNLVELLRRAVRRVAYGPARWLGVDSDGGDLGGHGAPRACILA